MKRVEKKELIDQLEKKFKKSKFFYIVDPTGLTANEVNLVRRECYNNSVDYTVAKNTFIVQALCESYDSFEKEILGDSFKQTSAIFFLDESKTSFPAKLIKKLKLEKSDLKLSIKCAYLDGDVFLGDSSLAALCALRSKNEMIGSIIESLKGGLPNLIKAIADSKSEA